MDPQNVIDQQPVSPMPDAPVQPPVSVQEKKNNKWVWIIAGIIVLLIGFSIGLLLH